MPKTPKRQSFIFIGSLCGFIFAGWVFPMPRSAFCVFFQKPLTWFLMLFYSSQGEPRWPLNSFIIQILIWFIYWACLGALIGFFLYLLFQLSKRQKKETEAAIADKTNEQPLPKKWSGMRFIYLVGFLILAMYFTVIKQKVHGWKPVGFILLWLFIIGAIAFPLLRFIRRFPPMMPYSSWCAIYAAIRTLPVALLFSPTFLDFYMFGFPAPATLALLGILFAGQKQMAGLMWRNVTIAIVCFFVFWFVIWIVYFIWQSEKLSKAKPMARGIRYLGFSLAAFISITLAVHWIYHAPLLHSETSAFSMAEEEEDQRYTEWCNSFPRYIISRMCDYYQLHPECFKPTGQGEEIEIDGFTAFIKNDDYFKNGNRASVSWGKIRDPWGEPVGFVEDLNMDGYIDFLGQHRIVLKMGTLGKPEGLNSEHHFGIYKRSPFKGRFGQPWERIFAETY